MFSRTKKNFKQKHKRSSPCAEFTQQTSASHAQSDVFNVQRLFCRKTIDVLGNYIFGRVSLL